MRAGVAAAVIAVLILLPASATAQVVDTTCQFSLTRLDATTTNVLAVDTNAVYWGGTYGALPGTRIRIEGQYPHSRYMSWNVYDSAARPIDALSDSQLAPDPDSSNPFLPGADRTVTQRSYTAFIEVGPRPAQPAPNTLYTGDSQGGTFLYRVYVPDAGRDQKGGVPLPKPDGGYTIVVSTAEQRPANARPECGVTWLPWGPQTQGLLIYRHMLADPSFAQAIQNVPQPGAELDTMGDYYPSGEYLAGPGDFGTTACPRG